MKRKYKPRESQVILGPTFMARGICKHCGTGPYYCFFLVGSVLHLNPRQHLKFSDDLLNLELRYLKDPSKKHLKTRQASKLSRFTYPLDYTRHRPVLSRSTIKKGKYLYIDLAECKCLKTSWIFNETTGKTRPEIVNRLGPYKYPQKLTE